MVIALDLQVQGQTLTGQWEFFRPSVNLALTCVKGTTSGFVLNGATDCIQTINETEAVQTCISTHINNSE